MRCSWGLRLAIRFADVLDNRRWFDASDSSLHGAVPSNEGIYTKCPSQRCRPWQRGGLGPLLLVQQVKYGQGAVFELKASQGSWTETVLYSFRGGTQHGWPAAGVYLDASGKIFGTLSDNGDDGLPGAVFRLEANSDGKWTETLLHAFGKRGDGGFPWSDLVPDAAGSLYGTTYVGGNTGNGVIYKLTQNAKGNWIETVFFSFNYHDGASPADNPVTFDAAGNLFVGTVYGGVHEGYDGYGVVLELAP
jgi:uncharacterized repeat protein (TIGR03803 family)